MENSREDFHRNIFYDMVYVINLKKNKNLKNKSLIQLKRNLFKNYKIIDAIDGKNEFYNNMYNSLIKNMSATHIKYNFQKGALGCFLSHIECIKDAKTNNYEKILILEDDFIIINNYNEEIKIFFDNIDNSWDFIYFGKKQLGTIEKINEYVYSPNNSTYATHALLIKNTIFDAIINLANKIENPIDIALHTLYDKYKFYSLNKDLFISDDSSSDIQIGGARKKIWNWDLSLYKSINTITIKNCIIYGLKRNFHHTHHYIHEMYYNHIKHYYPMLNVFYFDECDIPTIDKEIFNDCIVICSPTHCLYDTYIYGKNTYYIFHLDVYDNVGYKNLEDFFNKDKVAELLKNINNYSILLCRENAVNLNYFEKNEISKQICLPWFSSEFYNQLIHVKNNIFNYYEKFQKYIYITYFGSIWQCNVNTILELIEICNKKQIHLLLRGRIFGIDIEDKKKIMTSSEFCTFESFDYKNDANNSFELIDEKYGIKCLLTIQGENHINSYITNRIFEATSKGYLAITNNPIVKKYFTTAIYNDKLDLLLENIINIMNDKEMYCKIINEQIDEFIKKFYSYNIINSNFDFLKKIAENNNELLTFDNINSQTNYKLWFCSNNSYINSYFSNVLDNDGIIEKLITNSDLLINSLNYKSMDIFLIEQLIKVYNYDIYIDEDFHDIANIIEICNLNNVPYKIKNKLQINCLLSSQRTGSTLIVDVLQKSSKNVLALSEIFYFYDEIETYTSSHDCANNSGILHGYNIFPFTGKNISDYFKQFEDFAIFQNKNLLLYKLTIDFNLPLENFFNLNNIIDFISQSKHNIIYLDRNIFDIYTSKKLADIYSYSNTIYESIPEKFFKYSEVALLNLRKNHFENLYVNNDNYFDNKYFTNYLQLTSGSIATNINFILNNLNKTTIQYVDCDDYKVFLLNDNKYFNIKQNCFLVNEFLGKKYWS